MSAGTCGHPCRLPGRRDAVSSGELCQCAVAVHLEATLTDGEVDPASTPPLPRQRRACQPSVRWQPPRPRAPSAAPLLCGGSAWAPCARSRCPLGPPPPKVRSKESNDGRGRTKSQVAQPAARTLCCPKGCPRDEARVALSALERDGGPPSFERPSSCQSGRA